MARPLRIEYDGAVYHVTSRGNAGKPIFKDNLDRSIFLETLHKANKRHNLLCHAYCLMNNHYHLIIETPDGNLSKGMRQINGVYTQSFNRQHNKAGHVFQGRYKAILIQKESHLIEVCRYVVLNPVRAKAVKRPEDWKWSSYRATAGMEKPHSSLTTDWITGQFAIRKMTAQKKYREFVAAGVTEESIWKDLKGQSLLGEEDFAEGLINYVKGYDEIEEIPKSQRYLNRPELKEIFNEDTLLNKRRRDDKIKEVVEKYGYSQKEVSQYLKMHYSTISRIMTRKQQK
ncbi:MAG TPA: helix-turn-helix domain-containing protein [Nitrospirae bacterium]|nr:transposase IS200 like protein [bacterium BMS3Abin06]HDH12466.1 helix-turn-helix domain-containing protein [Nitrospirota bacterium]HDZ02397.1 helix-turn-helix domain-containing protein [Nitrospirota bacterium]